MNIIVSITNLFIEDEFKILDPEQISMAGLHITIDPFLLNASVQVIILLVVISIFL